MLYPTLSRASDRFTVSVLLVLWTAGISQLHRKGEIKCRNVHTKFYEDLSLDSILTRGN
jgi:hypothetical protein